MRKAESSKNPPLVKPNSTQIRLNKNKKVGAYLFAQVTKKCVLWAQLDLEAQVLRVWVLKLDKSVAVLKLHQL